MATRTPLDDVLATGCSAWIRAGHIRAYVRYGPRVLRLHQNMMVPTLEIATVELPVRQQGRGKFTRWLTQTVEPAADDRGLYVYVENVLNKRFAMFWLQRPGYVQVSPDPDVPCFLRPPRKP